MIVKYFIVLLQRMGVTLVLVGCEYRRLELALLRYVCEPTEPLPATALCCDVKRRVPCQLKNKDLDSDPYTCRQLGCCFDAGDGHRPSYGGGRRRRRPRRRGPYGNMYGYGYGGWQPQDQPRCFRPRRSKQRTSPIIPICNCRSGWNRIWILKFRFG